MSVLREVRHDDVVEPAALCFPCGDALGTEDDFVSVVEACVPLTEVRVALVGEVAVAAAGVDHGAGVASQVLNQRAEHEAVLCESLAEVGVDGDGSVVLLGTDDDTDALVDVSEVLELRDGDGHEHRGEAVEQRRVVAPVGDGDQQVDRTAQVVVAVVRTAELDQVDEPVLGLAAELREVAVADAFQVARRSGEDRQQLTGFRLGFVGVGVRGGTDQRAERHTTSFLSTNGHDTRRDYHAVA